MPSSLSLIISSAWFKVRDMWLLLEHLRGHWSLISIFIASQGIGRPQKRERDGGVVSGWTVRMHAYIDGACCLTWAQLSALQNNYNSNNTGHWSQVTVTDIIILKRFEILQELPKCGTQTQSEHMLWESAAARLLEAGATDLQLVKNAVTAKLNEAKHNKTRCASMSRAGP